MKSHPFVAIVDDDESVRESLHSLLRSVGYKVYVFDSAEQFLVSTSRYQVDCLILDVRMPGMNGLELQRYLRGQSSNVPMIFITAHGDLDTQDQALSGGASAFLLKPLSEEEVLSALENALAKNN